MIQNETSRDIEMAKKRKDIQEIVKEYGIESDEDTEKMLAYCYRKMEVAGIKDKENYLPMLFKDEIKDALFRYAINFPYLC